MHSILEAKFGDDPSLCYDNKKSNQDAKNKSNAFTGVWEPMTNSEAATMWSVKEGVLNNFAIFKGKHLGLSLFLKNFMKKRL